MKKIVGLGLVIVLSGALMAQEKSKKERAYDLMLKTLLSHSVEEIKVQQAVELTDVVWLDARAKEEYDVSKIKDAVWVGYDDFSVEKVAGIPKSAQVVVYCSVGYRSEKIAEKLEKEGYEHVRNLYGGIFSWVNKEHPIVDSLGQKTENIHAYNRLWGQWLNKGKKVY